MIVLAELENKIITESSYGFPVGAVAGAVSVFAVQWLGNHFGPQWGESTREMLGRWALKIPYIKQMYDADIEKEYKEFCVKTMESWEKFGSPITEIPDEGWGMEKLFQLIEKYGKITNLPLEASHFSGTIYFNDSKESNNFRQMPVIVPDHDYDRLSNKLRNIFNWSFDKAFLWNSLHDDEFGIGPFIDYQVVRMVADMFGGKKDEVMGFVTSGGTESLMVTARCYRNWGIQTKGHAPGESVIIAADTVHAAFLKASSAYFIKVVLIEADESGNMDEVLLKKMLKKHGDKVVAIVGSAPSYPTGWVDNITRLGLIAHDHGCGLHVDCCLGGFIVNNLDEQNSDFLAMKGVTSLSADTHKNGWAPKGSSVLVTKKLGEHNLAKQSIYAVPGWRGGVYGSPKDAGSQSVMPSLHALLALLGMGKDGYRMVAQEVQKGVQQLADGIKEHLRGEIEILGDHAVNVIAFRVNPALRYGEGATYALAHEMKKRKFVLNNLKGDITHFCVTGRFIRDEKAVNKFITALQNSFVAVEKMLAKDEPLPGDAGMYGTISAAIDPDPRKLATGKYIENMLLGEKGVKDAVSSYFLSKLDPYVFEEEN